METKRKIYYYNLFSNGKSKCLISHEIKIKIEVRNHIKVNDTSFNLHILHIYIYIYLTSL